LKVLEVPLFSRFGVREKDFSNSLCDVNVSSDIL
jgi:hypothetical protein